MPVDSEKAKNYAEPQKRFSLPETESGPAGKDIFRPQRDMENKEKKRCHGKQKRQSDRHQTRNGNYYCQSGRRHKGMRDYCKISDDFTEQIIRHD